VYVEDVCSAFLLAASVEDQPADAVYNVGTAVQTTIAEVVEVARRELDITEEPYWGSMENRIWDTSRWVCDNTLIKSALGWEPAHDFVSGFRKTVQWFRDNPSVIERYSASIRA
jgi:nucleoside-diphosphate-sugar epimerase